ncbi:MAG: glycosyltransferase family 2 protein [bacterium]|nr:glycosyltransferase family 2 protein [bacterium]
MVKKKVTKQQSLSVVIPAYNEEESLGYVLKNTLKDLPKVVRGYEVIIVDDGSTDKTGKIADTFARRDKHVRVIYQKHSGFNKAMIVGLRSAKKDYVAYLHAGGQDLIRDVVNCIRIMQNYDLVLGVRGKRIDYGLYRLCLSYGALIVYQVLFGITYEDVHWVYIWKTNELKKLKLDPNGGIFLLVESLVKFKRKGLIIGEAPAPYRPRYGGEAKNTSIKVIVKTLKSITKLWLDIVTGKI